MRMKDVKMYIKYVGLKVNNSPGAYTGISPLPEGLLFFSRGRLSARWNLKPP